MRCELKSEFRCRHSGTLVEHPARETCIDGAKVVHYPGEVRKRGGEGQKRRGVWHPGGGRRFQQFPAIGRSWKLLEAWGLGENPWKGLAKVELNKIITIIQFPLLGEGEGSRKQGPIGSCFSRLGRPAGTWPGVEMCVMGGAYGRPPNGGFGCEAWVTMADMPHPAFLSLQPGGGPLGGVPAPQYLKIR